jgi:outer membrane receptor protein involved in Fe transport
VIFGEDDLSLFTNDSVQERIPLPGQSPHTANLAVFYESQKLYARLSANYHASFLYELGADSDLDEYYDQAWHLDFTANYAITPHIRVFTDFVNITNAPLRFYLGTPDRIKQQEYYSWSCRFGLKFKF